MNLRYLGLPVLAFLALVLSSCLTSEPRADVQVTPGADLGRYKIVYFTFEDAWAANHTIVQLLQQEMQRRSYAVKVGEPLEEDKGRSMVLNLKHAGQSQDAQKGSVEKLRYLRFDLTDARSGQLLASVNRDGGGDLDPIEQKQFAKTLADDLFGAT